MPVNHPQGAHPTQVVRVCVCVFVCVCLCMFVVSIPASISRTTHEFNNKHVGILLQVSTFISNEADPENSKPSAESKGLYWRPQLD